jgi:hypothetical protein
VVKSKVARVLIKLVLIFVAITIYFYFQHPVQYRCTNLKAVFPVGDMTLVLDDIRISDLDEDKLSGRYRGGEIPWIYRMIFEANLPMDWSIKLADIVAFYSRPPRTGGDVANIEISGTLLYPAGLRNPISTDNRDILDCTDVDINPGWLSGHGGTFRSGNNYCTLNYHGTFNHKDINKTLTLSITDEANNKTSYIYFTPHWVKERVLKWGRSPMETEPVWPAESYIEWLQRGNTQKAKECLTAGLRKKFEIPPLDSSFKDGDIRYTVEWQAHLMGYIGAYRITAEAGKFLNESRTDFEAATDKKLVFYVVKNSDDNKLYIVRVHEPYTAG